MKDFVSFGPFVESLSLLMPIDHILAALVEERDKLSRAIEVLGGTTPRRGRPPKNPTPSSNGAGVATPAPAHKRRGHMSPAARKAQSARMKRFWAAKRRKGAAGTAKKS
jgi:hypothetical protein